LLIGETTAETIKIQIANAVVSDEGEKNEWIEVDGSARSRQITGLPRTVILDEVQVNEAIKPTLLDIIKGVKEVLEQCPPELAQRHY